IDVELHSGSSDFDAIGVQLGAWFIVLDLLHGIHRIDRFNDHAYGWMNGKGIVTRDQQLIDIGLIAVFSGNTIGGELKIAPVLWHAYDLYTILNGVIGCSWLIGNHEGEVVACITL